MWPSWRAACGLSYRPSARRGGPNSDQPRFGVPHGIRTRISDLGRLRATIAPAVHTGRFRPTSEKWRFLFGSAEFCDTPGL